MDKNFKELADFIVERVAITQKEALTLEEASIYTGRSKSNLYKLTMENKIPYYKPMGKCVYFDRKELENWMLSNRITPVGEIEEKAQAYCRRG